MKLSEFSQSHRYTIALIAIGGLVLLLGAFSAGEHIGARKASFAFQNGNNFVRNFSDTHGTAGKVLSVTLPTVTIEDHDGTEKVIAISDQTVIRRSRDTLHPEDIRTGDFIVAIGDPNAQSQIAAKLIRVLPPPPAPPQPQQ